MRVATRDEINHRLSLSEMVSSMRDALIAQSRGENLASKNGISLRCVRRACPEPAAADSN